MTRVSRRSFLGLSFAAAVTWSVGEAVPAAAGSPDTAHGYVVMDVTPASVTATMTAVRSIRSAATPELLTLRTFRIGEGTTRLETVDRGTRALSNAGR